MKQRHAFADLHVHAVFKTWRRMPIVKTAEREDFLRRVVIAKAHETDAWVGGFGAWEECEPE